MLPSQPLIQVDTDFFGSRPVLLDRRTFRLGADFEELGTQEIDLDETAFWEAFLWDMPLGKRSLDQNIEFLRPESRYTIDREKHLITSSPIRAMEPASAHLGPVAIVERIDRRLQEVCNDLVTSLGPAEKILLDANANELQISSLKPERGLRRNGAEGRHHRRTALRRASGRVRIFQ